MRIVKKGLASGSTLGFGEMMMTDLLLGKPEIALTSVIASDYSAFSYIEETSEFPDPNGFGCDMGSIEFAPSPYDESVISDECNDYYQLIFGATDREVTGEDLNNLFYDFKANSFGGA